MNISAIIGLISSNGVFVLSIFLSLGGLSGFIDSKSIIIVVGGTISAAIVCIPLDSMKSIVKQVIAKVIKSNNKNYMDIVNQILELAQAKRKGDSAFDAAVKQIKEEYLKEASELLFWAEAEVSEEEFRDLLETKATTYMGVLKENSKTFKTLAKFPPAFGMMGTVLGLIALLQSLGNPDAKSQIGPAMAVALVTTLYGIAINNLLIIPVGERLAKAGGDDKKVYTLCIEGLLLIQQKKPTKYIEEKLKSFLLPEEIDASGKKAAA